MERKRYDLNFKKMVVAKGKEIGNMTAVARQHDLDPKLVLRWAKELERKDLVQLDRAALKQPVFVPSAADYAALEKEHENSKSSMQSRQLKGKSSATC
ncbi:transposase [Paenibacillus xylaniclasticus]|uniref:transposase n=1 Tax=Paenibacillus xylaniclasticus TaxID=588083 RepID=UPI000FD7811A|nr:MULTISPECIES: transposase [Paenibacillus]GFN30962.1 hypothetical protein PCURB6_12220 [Paenibacillus curdlanolyticus]